MPGTLTTTYGNRANARQLELRTVLQIFRHFFCRHHFWRGAFVQRIQKSRARIDFPSENGIRRRTRNVYKYFLDGKISEPRKIPREIFFEKRFPGGKAAAVSRSGMGRIGRMGPIGPIGPMGRRARGEAINARAPISRMGPIGPIERAESRESRERRAGDRPPPADDCNRSRCAPAPRRAAPLHPRAGPPAPRTPPAAGNKKGVPRSRDALRGGRDGGLRTSGGHRPGCASGTSRCRRGSPTATRWSGRSCRWWC